MPGPRERGVLGIHGVNCVFKEVDGGAQYVLEGCRICKQPEGFNTAFGIDVPDAVSCNLVFRFPPGDSSAYSCLLMFVSPRLSKSTILTRPVPLRANAQVAHKPTAPRPTTVTCALLSFR